MTGKAASLIAAKKKEDHPNSFISNKQRSLGDEVFSKEQTSFSYFKNYLEIIGHKKIGETLHVDNPFYKVSASHKMSEIEIDGQTLINFSSYNYLGLCHHDLVNAAAIHAINQYGTSVSASRMVSGENPLTLELEHKIATHYQTEDAVVMVSGHATNVTTISTLFNKNDLILYDESSHNSLLQGIKLSGAAKFMFKHNDLNHLETLLKKERLKFHRTLIVVEGLYGMDGDSIDLKSLVDLKEKHGAFLMVDEAHSLGVLGKKGYGVFEEKGVNPNLVDIWMGTLSKTLAAAGGYIAGNKALITLLKYSASGFVYSVGISPPVAAASLKALELLHSEPRRVEKLHENTKTFYQLAKDKNINLGLAKGYAVMTVICKSSKKAVMLSNQLFKSGVYALPIIYPAVPEKKARVRFFITSNHQQPQIAETLSTLVEFY